MESLSDKVVDLKACKETPTQVFFCEYCKIFKSIYFQIICKRLLLPLEVFCIRNLFIVARRMLHLAYKPLEVFFMRNLLIVAMKILHLAYKKTLYGCSLSIFLTTIAFSPMKYLFRILENCVVFIAQISYYKNSRHCIN